MPPAEVFFIVTCFSLATPVRARSLLVVTTQVQIQRVEQTIPLHPNHPVSVEVPA